MLTVGGAIGGNGATGAGGTPDSPEGVKEKESPEAKTAVEDVASGFTRECSLLEI